MSTFLHEAALWSALALICGACVYVDLIPGLMVTGACAVWVGMVLRRGNS